MGTKLKSILRAAGADVDTCDAQGYTPLMIAAHNNYWMVMLLLEEGATIDLKNNRGETALDIAITKNNVSVIGILMEHERLELVVRPDVVTCSGVALPVELAELCGDYVCMAAARRAIENRQRT